MFDIGWGELLVIGVVALIAIGPKELPGVLRMVGQWMGKIRRMASEFQGQFQEAMREAEMADVKRQMDDVTRELTSHFDPLESVHKELERATDLDNPANTSAAPSALAAPAADAETHTPAAEPVELEPAAVEPAALAPSPPAPSADHVTEAEPQRQAGGSGAA
jgi:sec-independent protein translocase protein TatB